MKRFLGLPIAVALLGSIFSCSGSDGASGLDALTSVDEEPPGQNCEFGGVLVRAGNDDNQNGILDSSESGSATYLCNGADGEDAVSYLTSSTDEPAGANCASGGVRVDMGPDSDGSGTLEESEITATEYVCDGDSGADGADGAEGPQGPAGPAGSDGVNALVNLVNESPGANCTNGGIRVESGPDTDGSGNLEAGEVTETRYVCDGADGQNGADGQDGGGAFVVTAYSGANAFVTSTGSAVTLETITLTAPGPGRVFLVSTSDVFCGANCGTAPIDGYMANTTSSSGSPTVGSRSFFFLAFNVTESITRSDVFTVTSSGTRTYYLRGQAGFGNRMDFYRGQMTAIFLPN